MPIPDQLPVDFADALERARPRLGRLGSDVLFFSSIGSTSDVASTLAARGDREGAVVVAEAQTAGRGRRGRTWFSPPSSGLYVSVVLAPGQARVTPDRAIALLTLAAGVALAEAVELVAATTTTTNANARACIACIKPLHYTVISFESNR